MHDPPLENVKVIRDVKNTFRPIRFLADWVREAVKKLVFLGKFPKLYVKFWWPFFWP